MKHLIAARLIDTHLSFMTRCGRGITSEDVTQPAESDCEACLASLAVEGSQANRRWKVVKEAASPRRHVPTQHGYEEPKPPKK